MNLFYQYLLTFQDIDASLRGFVNILPSLQIIPYIILKIMGHGNGDDTKHVTPSGDIQQDLIEWIASRYSKTITQVDEEVAIESTDLLMFRRNMDIVISTHIKIRSIVACEHHRIISAHKLHLAIIAGYSHLSGFRRLDGDIVKLRIDNFT